MKINESYIIVCKINKNKIKILYYLKEKVHIMGKY